MYIIERLARKVNGKRERFVTANHPGNKVQMTGIGFDHAMGCLSLTASAEQPGRGYTVLLTPSDIRRIVKAVTLENGTLSKDFTEEGEGA